MDRFESDSSWENAINMIFMQPYATVKKGREKGEAKEKQEAKEKERLENKGEKEETKMRLKDMGRVV